MQQHYKLISELSIVLKQNNKTMHYSTLKLVLLDAGFGFSKGSNNRGVARSVSAAWKRWNDESDPDWKIRDAIATVYVNKWGIPAWKLYQLPMQEPVEEVGGDQDEGEEPELLGFEAQCAGCGEYLTTAMRQFDGDGDTYVECSHCQHHNNLTRIEDDFMRGEMDMMYPDGLPDGWDED